MDIIAIIFFTYWIGPKARKKGQPVLKWRWFVVLTWISFELIGAMVGFLISKNIFLAGLLGIASGAGGYLLAKYRLDQLPDTTRNDHWTDRLGKQDEE